MELSLLVVLKLDAVADLTSNAQAFKVPVLFPVRCVVQGYHPSKVLLNLAVCFVHSNLGQMYIFEFTCFVYVLFTVDDGVGNRSPGCVRRSYCYAFTVTAALILHYRERQRPPEYNKLVSSFPHPYPPPSLYSAKESLCRQLLVFILFALARRRHCRDNEIIPRYLTC